MHFYWEPRVAPAQVKEPPRAEKLDVQIRYRIRADRDERIRQFLALEKHLASLGFEDARKNDPDRELDILDPTAERFTGTISSRNVLNLLDEPRVLNILFAPAGYTYPDSPEKPVPVRIVLRDGLLPTQQQLLHGQVGDAARIARVSGGARLRHTRLHAGEGRDPLQEPDPP